ncbi:mucolipin-3-like [Ornithodoros turicata]|uniref:mucolipin-3-like n=1 Tax=Ornithodoros turicata TaxID=34597 RepID=UPI003138B922
MVEEHDVRHTLSEVQTVHHIRCDHGRPNTVLRSHRFVTSVDINLSESNNDTDHSGALLKDLDRLPEELTEDVRKRLRNYFMNPIEKWRSRRRLPWKLILQILKVLVVTAQVILFGSASIAFQDQHRNMRIALERLLLKDWDTARDVLLYPPSQGPYAVYTAEEFYSHIEYAVKHYMRIRSESINIFWYSSESEEVAPIKFCMTTYKSGIVWPSNSTLFVDSREAEECIDLKIAFPADSDLWDAFSMEKVLSDAGIGIVFEQLVSAELRLKLATLHKRTFLDAGGPDCYDYNVFVIYHNSRHSGEITVTMMTTTTLQLCKRNTTHYRPIVRTECMIQALNAVIILLCFFSGVLCSRSLYKAQTLRVEATELFEAKYKKELTLSDKLLFLDFWLVLIIVDDCLLVIGSSLEIEIDERITPGLVYDICSLFLGLGTLFMWCGFLRYVGYFRTYNILILSLKRATPTVVRFLLCGALLFFGYVICGWVVIGPHHTNFETASKTAECLFTIANGNEIFSTFAMMSEKDNAIVRFFFAAYLSSFTILFGYLVVSLFVTIIVDAHNIFKDKQSAGPFTSTVQLFVKGCENGPLNDMSSSQSRGSDVKSAVPCR